MRTHVLVRRVFLMGKEVRTVPMEQGRWHEGRSVLVRVGQIVSADLHRTPQQAGALRRKACRDDAVAFTQTCRRKRTERRP